MIGKKSSVLGTAARTHLCRNSIFSKATASSSALSYRASALLTTQQKCSLITPSQCHLTGRQLRALSTSWSGRGHDMLGEALMEGGSRPKVLLEAMAPSGFDVSNLLKKIDPHEVAPHGALHMMGSILAFPTSCFLWKVEDPSQITTESLAPVILHRPKIEFLFLGTAKPMDQAHLSRLQADMKQKCGIVVEWLPLSEAMATFNILNGEDRMVATALVLDRDESNYVHDSRDD